MKISDTPKLVIKTLGLALGIGGKIEMCFQQPVLSCVQDIQTIHWLVWERVNSLTFRQRLLLTLLCNTWLKGYAQRESLLAGGENPQRNT